MCAARVSGPFQSASHFCRWYINHYHIQISKTSSWWESCSCQALSLGLKWCILINCPMLKQCNGKYFQYFSYYQNLFLVCLLLVFNCKWLRKVICVFFLFPPLVKILCILTKTLTLNWSSLWLTSTLLVCFQNKTLKCTTFCHNPLTDTFQQYLLLKWNQTSGEWTVSLRLKCTKQLKKSNLTPNICPVAFDRFRVS